jgi:predicted PP-loop superfamily ATPase
MQANVRGKLFNMLGDRGEVAAAAAAASSSSSSRSAHRKPNSAAVDPGSCIVTGKIDRDEEQESDRTYHRLDGVQIDMIDPGDYGDLAEDFEWVCTTCTLINEPSSLSCLTCDAIRIY